MMMSEATHAQAIGREGMRGMHGLDPSLAVNIAPGGFVAQSHNRFRHPVELQGPPNGRNLTPNPFQTPSQNTQVSNPVTSK